MIRFLSFTAPSNIPASATTQKTVPTPVPAPVPAPDPPADEEEEGWFTFIITYKHRHIWLKTELVSKCHFFTDDKFAEEAEEEESVAAQDNMNVETELTKEPSKEKPKKWFQTKPKPQAKPPSE